MLNHNLKHHLLPSALLVASFLTLTGCTNNDYDLNNVDATMTPIRDKIAISCM